jgi:uncharacterized protein YodC (DUF2158 family)
MTLKPGDLVVLKSGGPTMTVDTVNTDIFDGKVTGVLCAWFVGEKLERVRFDCRALEPAEPQKASPRKTDEPVYPWPITEKSLIHRRRRGKPTRWNSRLSGRNGQACASWCAITHSQMSAAWYRFRLSGLTPRLAGHAVEQGCKATGSKTASWLRPG